MATAMLTFTVRRSEPVLVGPEAPTQREIKRLSDIDDQGTLRMQVPFFCLYRGKVHADEGRDDPAGAIRRALGEALVPYYPLAGQLREVEGRKLLVDCTGEGVLFAEADADVRLPELEAAATGRMPPSPCMDQLLLDEQGSGGVLDLNCPLLCIQVTRLLCGGFVLAVRLNHTICDGVGLADFLSAVGELARGLPPPAIPSPWSRDLLEARSPPKPAFPHRELFDGAPIPPSPPPDDMVMRTFTFGPADVTAIRRSLPPELRAKVTTFEALTAALWRVRTAALEVRPDEAVRLVVVVGFRGMPELELPAGYYGNAAVPSVAVTTAGALRASSLGDTARMVREAKEAVTAEYVRSMVDLLVLSGRPAMAARNLFVVSDNRRAGFHRADVGWGAPVYGGPSTAAALFGLSYLVGARNGDGEGAVAVSVVLPRAAMDRFASEVERLLS